MHLSRAEHPEQAGHGGGFVLGWIERALIAFGVACLLVYGVMTAQAALYQRRANAEVDAMVAARRLADATLTTKSSRSVGGAAVPAVPMLPGDVIGRVEVPRLRLSAAVAEGDDDATLGNAVGHLPDTPLPWQKGNVALAAHRDGLFRALKDVRLDDDVRVVTGQGDFRYRVTKTLIVNPDDVWVIAPTGRPTLTLITCYPFAFVGHAPQRFIVQAERVDAEPAGVAFQGTAVR